MRKLKKLLSILLLTLLSGCYTNYGLRSTLLPLERTDLQTQVSQALESKTFTSEPLASCNWWEFFNDPHLNLLIEMGLASHPDVAIADAKIRLALERSTASRSFLFPQVDFNPSYQRHRFSKNAPFFFPQLAYYNQNTLELDFSYELDLWNKNRSLFYAELDEYEAVWADRSEAELLLATAIAEAYFNLQGNKARLKVANERLEERKKTYELLRQKYRSGIIAEFFVLEIDTEIAKLQDFAFLLQQRIETNIHAIGALVGNPSCCSIEAFLEPNAYFYSPFPLPCALPLDLISRRPEIIAQRWRIEKAGFYIKAAQANFYPNIDLTATPALISKHLSNLLTARSFDIIGEVALHLPIFNAGRLEAELGERREETEIAILEYNRFILKAVQDVSDWMTVLRVSEQRIEMIDHSLKDARQLLKLYKSRFEKGIGDYVAVLNAEENVLLQEDILALATLDRLQAALGLMKALGGGYHECF